MLASGPHACSHMCAYTLGTLSQSFKGVVGGRPSELPQWIKALAAKPDALNSIPEAHIAEGEKGRSPLFLTSTWALWQECAQIRINCIILYKCIQDF